MISDDERREVVARLREWVATTWYELPWSRDAMQSLGEMVGAVPGENIVERIADLIDRHTCHDVGGAYEFRCSVCGCVIHIFLDDGFGEYGEDDSAMTIGGDSLYVPRYCPNCGAEVVDDGER